MENATSLVLISGRNQFSFKFISLLLLFIGMSIGSGWGQVISESFNEATTTSTTGGIGMPNNGYATGAYTLNSGVWNFTSALRGTQNVNSSPGCQIQSATGSNIITPTIPTSGVGVISFYAAGTSAGAAVNVSISINGGAFTSGTSFTGLTTTSTLKQITLNDASNNIRVKFTRTAGTLTLDDIVITAAEPTAQTTAITFSSVTTNSMTVNWTSGNGGRRAVFMKAASGTITNPTDGVAYTASSDWNSKGTQLGTSGYYCIYNGTGSSVSLTNLSASTTYYIQSFEYNSDNNTTPTASSINYNTNTSTNNPNSQTTASSGSTPPSLVADATLNTVDNNIDITFTEDATWRGLITAVKVDGTALTPTTDYVLSAGNIQLKPSGGNSLLTTAGSKTITVEAAGYTVATVTQAINAGAAKKLAMKTQPAAPASNGAVLATQPEVYIQDLYGNATTSTATITAAVGAGTWTLGGTTAVAGVAGTVSYSGLTATSSAAVSGATISFSGTGLTGITSGTFNIPTPPPTITVTTLDGFGSVTVNSASGELSYVVSAEQLTADLIITPPVDFEISTTSGSGFISNPSTLTLTQTGGTVNPTTIYVRFSPKTVQTYSATITHTSTGATTKNVAVSGTATATSAPVAATATDITDISFTANWGSVSGASGYKLDVSTTPFGAATNATDLFISEYVEGTSNNKVIELFNGTGSTIDLSSYSLRKQVNGAGSFGGNLALTGSLANNSTYIIANGNANATILGLANATTASTPIDFNGNDAVGLYKSGIQIDVVGVVDQTTNWGMDMTLIRNSTVAAPTTSYSLSSEWTQYAIDYISNLGTHSFSGGTPSLLTGYNDLSVSGTSQSVTGLIGNTTYYYQVRSTAGGAASANSNSITVLTAPSAPTATEETDNSATGFVATWTLPAGGATSYTLDVATDNTFSTLVSGYNNLSVTGTTQAVTGLTPNTTYYYRIKATNATATATSGTITAATNNNLIVSSDINVSTLPVCATCDVIINAGATLTINENRTFNIVTINPKGKLTNSASTLTLDALNIESSATGTGTYIDNGTSNIAVSHVQQYLTSGRNWYVSIPVTVADTTVLGAAHAIKYWNEPTGAWKSPTALALDVRKGYIAAGTKSTGVVTFDGELNNGNATFNATRTGGAYKEGFNLIGNPYPSYVDWESAIKTNVGSSIWYRTKNLSGTYVFDTFNGVGTNNNQGGAVTGMIPPMQAVWIRVNEAQTSGSVQFTNAMRAHETGSNKFKAPAANNTIQQVLRLQVSNDVNSDEAIVLFNKNASNSVDVYDSPKMTNANSTVPEIYTVVNDNELVINGMNDHSPSTEISLGFRTGQNNTFSIKASEIANFETETQIILKDNELMTETNLSDGNAYTFTSDAIATTNRFSLVFKSAGVTTEVKNNYLNDKLVFVNKNSNNQLVVNCNSEIIGKGNIYIYNAIGQKLSQKAIINTSTIFDQQYTAGVYFINVVTNSGKSITKKITVD